MSKNSSELCWEHEFLKEVVVLVREEFYRTGNATDSDKLIEELLTGGSSLETDSDDG